MLGRELDAQLLQLALDSMGAGQLADHDVPLCPDNLGFERFVSQSVAHDPVHVHSGGVRECIGSHQGLVDSHVDSRDSLDQVRGLGDLVHVDALDTVIGQQVDGNLLHGNVSRPLADSVDGGVHDGRSRLDGRQGVGGGQTQIVVAVHRDGDLDVLPQFRNQIGHGLGDDDSDGIGDVDGACSRILNRLVDGFHELQVGTGGVLAGELHLQTVLACVFHGFHGLRPDFLGSHLQFVLHVQVGGRDEGMDVIASAVDDSVDVPFHGPSQTQHLGVQTQFVDLFDSVPFDLAGGGKSRLDVPYAELVEGLSDAYLVLGA